MDKININKDGIFINGKPEILLMSSFFYFRIPKERWRMRMQQIKLSGYNTLDVYFPWNFHETAPGKWSFEGMRDITAFLKMAKEEALYIVARVGPYICAEWDGGGMPAWLFTGNRPLRQDDPRFLEPVYTWLDRIFPLLVPWQFGRGGTVVAVQVENELDFFPCKSPHSYVRKLCDRALFHGVCVPLINCCGQADAAGAGGMVEGVKPSFNYPDTEEKALYFRSIAAACDAPLLIAEGFREHSYLKRLLCCGAKLIGAYNQAASTTFDFYQGLTNWCAPDYPVSYITSDYDFDSMIGSAGELRQEYFQARLFSSFLNTFAADLAAGVPVCRHGISAASEVTAPALAPALKTASGLFFPLANPGQDTLRTEVRYQGKEVLCRVPENYCCLLPVDLQLSKYGINAVITLSNYEIAWIDPQGEQPEIVMYGFSGGPWTAHVAEGGEERIYCRPEPENNTLIQCGGFRVRLLHWTDAASQKSPFLPEIPKRWQTEPEQRTNAQIAAAPFDWEDGPLTRRPVAAMEENGVNQGFAVYELDVPRAGELLLHQPADFVEIFRGKETAGYRVCCGQSVLLPVQPGGYRFVVESWGHTCFERPLLPVFRMNSLKGIKDIIWIRERREISRDWLVQPGEFNPDRLPLPSALGIMTNYGGFARGDVPYGAVYQKNIELSGASGKVFLYFGKAGNAAEVYVNGNHAGKVIHDHTYLDITDHVRDQTRISLAVWLLRKYSSDAAGPVYLITGSSAGQCGFGKINLFNLKPQTTLKPMVLPQPLNRGSRYYMKLKIEEKRGHDVKIICCGKGIKLMLLCNGHVAARIVLAVNGIGMTGGNPAAVYLPGEWITRDNPVTVLCQAIDEGAVLEPFNVFYYPADE